MASGVLQRQLVGFLHNDPLPPLQVEEVRVEPLLGSGHLVQRLSAEEAQDDLGLSLGAPAAAIGPSGC